MALFPVTMKGVSVSLLSAVTSGTGSAYTVPISSVYNRISVIGAGTIQGGTVSIEEADSPDYTGTWSVIQSVNGTTLSGGAVTVIHTVGTIGAIRARISSNITGGGTISVNFMSGGGGA